MSRWFVGIVLIGLLAGVLTTLIVRPSLAFTLGVTRASVAAEVKPRQEVCQRPIQIPADGEFDRVGFSLGTYFRPGPPVTLSVHDDRNGRVLATAKLRGGYPDIADAPRHVLDLGKTIETERPIRVCLANTGTRKVAVFGNANVANRPSGAFMRGKELPSDLDLTSSASHAHCCRSRRLLPNASRCFARTGSAPGRSSCFCSWLWSPLPRCCGARRAPSSLSPPPERRMRVGLDLLFLLPGEAAAARPTRASSRPHSRRPARTSV